MLTSLTSPHPTPCQSTCLPSSEEDTLSPSHVALHLHLGCIFLHQSLPSPFLQLLSTTEWPHCRVLSSPALPCLSLASYTCRPTSRALTLMSVAQSKPSDVDRACLARAPGKSEDYGWSTCLQGTMGRDLHEEWARDLRPSATPGSHRTTISKQR